MLDCSKFGQWELFQVGRYAFDEDSVLNVWILDNYIQKWKA